MIAHLNRDQTLRFVDDHAAVFDHEGDENPFQLAAWNRHFMQQVAQPDWHFFAPQTCAGSSMLLYATPQAPRRLLALANYYASLWSPALTSGASIQSDVDVLVGQLTSLRPRAFSVQLAPLSAESPVTDELVRAFETRHWFSRRYVCFGNWYLRCEGLSFNDFMAARESRLINTWKRKAKKLMGAPGAATRVEIVTDPACAEAAIAAYEQIYARSWKQAEPYPRFVGEWARICARNGWLRMGLAWVEGTPIAAQFWFTVNRRAYIFKLAYDEAFSSWSAGTVLSAELFRHSLDVDRVVEIDYLTGDDAYKKSWMTERRERIGLLAANPFTSGGLLTATLEFGGQLHRRLRRPPATAPAAAPAA